MSTPSIPGRQTGSHHDTVTMYCTDAPAEPAYATLRSRLYAIDRWGELNKGMHTEFCLLDATGHQVTRAPQIGDHIRIDLSGPGSPTGDGFDWVRITALDEGPAPETWASLTITPCANPTGTSDDIAHFYAAGATNTFVIRQIGNCLLAEVHGRNETPNVSEGTIVDRLRNGAVALAGKVGIGQVQWKDWTDGMISVIQPEADR